MGGREGGTISRERPMHAVSPTHTAVDCTDLLHHGAGSNKTLGVCEERSTQDILLTQALLFPSGQTPICANHRVTSDIFRMASVLSSS